MTRIIVAFIAVFAFAPAATAQDIKRQIIPVAGDVYLFQNNFHLSLIVATSEGTVRVDPINAEAGAWLNDNLASIGAQPVSHLIYSHSHGDHASGGSAHPGATVIAYEKAPADLDGVVPDMRVGDDTVLTIGGKTIELTNLGSGHDDHMLAVVVRPENVAFIVDVAAPKRLPFRNFGGANLDDWIGQIEAAQTLDFDIFAPGHGGVGVKADLDDAHQYMLDLKAGVLAGLKAGKSVEDLQSELTLAKYSDWGQYGDWRVMNIEGMAGYLQASGQLN